MRQMRMWYIRWFIGDEFISFGLMKETKKKRPFVKKEEFAYGEIQYSGCLPECRG